MMHVCACVSVNNETQKVESQRATVGEQIGDDDVRDRVEMDEVHSPPPFFDAVAQRVG